MKYLITLFVGVLIAMPLVAVQAQGGLSDEEQALLDRVLAAVENVDNYSSFTAESTQTTAIDAMVSLSGINIEISRTGNISILTTYIAGDPNDNLHSDIIVESSSSQGGMGQSQVTNYTLQGEVRYVDGVLYAQAAYLSSEGEVPALPDGWVEVADPEDFPELGDLNLADYLDDDFNTPDFFADPDKLIEAISSVSSESGTLDDGTEVEIITFTIDGAAAFDLFGGTGAMELPAEADPSAIMELVDESSTISVQAMLDGEDNLVGMSALISLTLSGDDASAIFGSEIPPGAEFSFAIQGSFTQFVYDINAELEPVAAPEMEE